MVNELLYYIDKDSVKSIERTRDKVLNKDPKFPVYYPTEDDAYIELLHRLKERAQAVEDRWQESIKRRFGL